MTSKKPAKGRRGKAAPIKLDHGPFRIDSGGRDLSKHGVDLTPWVRKPKGTIVVSDQIMRDLFAGLVASGVAADGGNLLIACRPDQVPSVTAAVAYKIAYALMAERAKRLAA